MFSGKLRIASRVITAGALALGLGACAVYEPAPAPAYPAYPAYGYAPGPAYGYAPGYYYGPSTSFSFGYNSGPYHHHHWRG